MIRYECDRCAARLGENDPRRFIVKMEVYAATGRIDFDENDEADSGEALSAAIEALSAADADAVEDQTYRCFRFDVCDSCQKVLLKHPLG